MLLKIFAKNKSKKKIFTTIFGVVFFAAIFWLSQPVQKVEAADEIYCTTDINGGDYTGDCESNAEDCSTFLGTCSGYTSTCTVNAKNYSIESSIPLYTGLNYCGSESAIQTKTRKCRVGKCPDNNAPTSGVGTGLKDGDPCTVRKLFGADVIYNNVAGKWDVFDKKCINCAGNKESLVCGDSSSIYLFKSGSLGVCNGTPDNKFEIACDNTIDPACDEKDTGDNCGGVKTCDASGKCVAPAVSVLTITASPTAITQGTTTPITFTVTDASGSVSGAAVAISGAVSASCSSTTGSDGKCTASVTATSTGTATATASKTGSTSGTTTITVQAAPACPKGSGAGSGTSFAVNFKQSTFTTSETFKISYMIPPKDQEGAICIYAPGKTTPNYSKSGTSDVKSTTVPQTNSNFDTTYKPTSTGTWKVTINNSSFCSFTSTCFATAEVTGASAPPPPLPPPSPPPPPPGTGGGTRTISSGCTDTTPPPAINVKIDYTNLNNDALAIVKPDGTTQAACQVLTGSASYTFNGVLDTAGVWTARIYEEANCTTHPTIVATGTITVPCPPTTSSTSPCGSGSGTYRSPLSYCSIQELIQGATGWILGLVSSIAILFLVYGGIMYTMAAGDETKMESAKNIIYYAILGLAIILISYTLITEVKTILKVK